MKVLVTGGNGFIGHAVCAELKSRGHEPVIFDRHQESAPARFITPPPEVTTPAQIAELQKALNDLAGDSAFHQKVIVLPPGARHEGSDTEFLLGDIKDATAVTDAIAHVDACIHLAGILGTSETISNPRPAAETNILGGLNVLEACAQYKTPLVNIAVGNHFENSTYSITKTTVERFAKMYAKYRDLPVCNVRAFNVYGPGQSVAQPYGTSRVRKIIPSFIARALHGEPIQVYGDGSQVMDMIYITDAAKCLVTALEDGLAYGRAFTYEAGTGRRTTVKQIAELTAAEVQRETGSTVPIEYLPMRPGETPGSEVLADPDMVCLLRDPDDLVKLEDGLHETVAHYRKVFGK
jgi:UDP-glucose 4-epimerase